MGRTTTLKPIEADVLRGRKPLQAAQFRELDSDVHTNHGSIVEKCLAIINGKLLSRQFHADCYYSYINIGPVDRDALEEVLAILREEGGWHTARIDHALTLGFVLEFHA